MRKTAEIAAPKEVRGQRQNSIHVVRTLGDEPCWTQSYEEKLSMRKCVDEQKRWGEVS